ncbi:MAG TPA: DUF4173 domain-containing protein [Pyrinomonadaceae bacterium]|jgi:hypothetical protein
MNEKTKTGLEILQAAVLLGVLGDVLLRATPWGLNAFLFCGAFVAAMLMLVWRRRQEFLSRQNIALNGALIFFAAMFVWRDSIQLRILDTLAIFTILAVLMLPALQIKTQIAGVFHYIIGFFWAGISAVFSPFFLIFADMKWKSIPQSGWSKHLISVLRGLLIAAPILLIFGALFVAADAVFEGFVQKTLNINTEALFTHTFAIGFFSWLTAGYLRSFLKDNSAEEEICAPADEVKTQVQSVTEIKDEEVKEKPALEEKKSWEWQNFDNSVLPRSFTLGAIETSIILGLMNLLFLSFVVVQVSYLFGGMDLVQNTPDFKLAEYARRGFGELVTVAALVLPILLVSHWLLRKDNPANEKIYRVLAGIQIVLLFVIMISATQRLFLLTGSLGYGLTTTRLYPMVFMIWLALVFVWFTITVLRGAREQFAWGALWSAMFVLGIMHVLNPDEYIVRTNVRLMQQGRMFDSRYLTELSDDAASALLESLPVMNFEQQCVVKNKLARRFEKAQNENDFRTWNFSRWKARRAIDRYTESLDTAGCPANTREYYEDF